MTTPWKGKLLRRLVWKSSGQDDAIHHGIIGKININFNSCSPRFLLLGKKQYYKMVLRQRLMKNRRKCYCILAHTLTSLTPKIRVAFQPKRFSWSTRYVVGVNQQTLHTKPDISMWLSVVNQLKSQVGSDRFKSLDYCHIQFFILMQLLSNSLEISGFLNVLTWNDE